MPYPELTLFSSYEPTICKGQIIHRLAETGGTVAGTNQGLVGGL
jgi:hypothetical protein